MIERQHGELKAAYQRTLQDRTELLRRIRAAELDLKGMARLMEQFQQAGKLQEYEECDNAYQQAYPDYSKMLRQLGVTEDELNQMASLLKPVDDYLRETGFYPGL